MQLQPRQPNESASHPGQPASFVSQPSCQPASQQASQPASSRSPTSADFPPTTCSCSQVRSTSQLAIQARQPVLPACQPASQPASQPRIYQECQVSSNNMQLQQSQLSESANHARQPVLSAIQPASQSASPQPPKSAQFPPTTCSCSQVSSTSQLAIQARQPVLPSSQPRRNLLRVTSFLQQHAVAAKSAQRVSKPG